MTGDCHVRFCESRAVRFPPATHQKTAGARLAGRKPRVKVHFRPTSSSWMNLAEVWFSIIERQAIHRGTFRSVGELTAAIKAFINGWNPRAHAFVMDQDPRADPRQSTQPNNFKHAALGSEKVAALRSRRWGCVDERMASNPWARRDRGHPCSEL